MKEKKELKGINKVLFVTVLTIGVIVGVLFIAFVIEISQPKALKPIIYLYPETEMQVSVKLSNSEKLSCSYPKYIDSWNVLAKPSGDLIDKKTNKYFYSLYWEGKQYSNGLDYIDGFCIKGEDTARFLEEKLKVLGLNEKEANEFIIYWLPKMESNKYNYIKFKSTEEINEYMGLDISPVPDTLIRVFMDFKPLNKHITLKEQQLSAPNREGFVVVEWGGSEVK
ncbi:MAG: hypothetical protein RSE00_04000 [Clostridia bacterium]